MSDSEDIPQNIILYRSNRAYLCHYDADKRSHGYSQMKNILGVTEEHDLLEVSGCLLRLAFWPTNYLWEQVDTTYYSWYERYGFATERLQQIVKGQLASHHKHETTPSNTTVRRTQRSRSRRRKLRGLENEEKMSLWLQIGLHFRCGDRSYIHGDNGEECVADTQHPHNNDHHSNPYMRMGNPYEIGLCAREVVQNHTRKLQEVLHHSLLTPTNSQEMVEHQFLSQLVTSDHDQAAIQMTNTTAFPFTFLTPHGCHIELDPSPACHEFTVLYWFLLSLSRYLIVQRIDSALPGPSSSFSRYAGIYGLQHNPFYPAKECTVPVDNLWLSRQQHGSWFC